MLTKYFSEHGRRVVSACNGEEALALAIAHRPRVVITDFQMPRMDGLELAMRLQSHPETSETPVIMLTARGHKLVPSEMRLTGIRHLMSKPFSAKELAGLVDECWGREDAPCGADPDEIRRLAKGAVL